MSVRMGNYSLSFDAADTSTAAGGTAAGQPAPSSVSYGGTSMVIAADGTVALDHTPGAAAGAAWAAMNAEYRDAEARVRQALQVTAGIRNAPRRRR